MKLASLLFAALLAQASAKTVRDIEFARVGDHSLKLDLHLPLADTPRKIPLVVYVHGGAWRAGSKGDMPLRDLVKQGFVVASVDYRLSTEAQFPAQMHDIKAAIRFLRAKGKDYKVDPTRIAIAGSSAGGHLAALVGVSNEVKELEGEVGNYRSESSAVQAIISLFGASNLESILSQSTPYGLSVRVPALQLLLGGQPSEKPDLARLASPVRHVGIGDPPLLLIHGDADPQMPFEQSRELQRAYEAAKLPVQFKAIPGGEHGGMEFYDEECMMLMQRFLEASARR